MMKKLFIISLTLIIVSCSKEYEMVYHRDGDLKTEIIKAKDDIDAYDQAFRHLTAMRRTEKLLMSKGVYPPLGQAPSYFSLYLNSNKVVIPVEKEVELESKWRKLE